MEKSLNKVIRSNSGLIRFNSGDPDIFGHGRGTIETSPDQGFWLILAYSGLIRFNSGLIRFNSGLIRFNSV